MKSQRQQFLIYYLFISFVWLLVYCPFSKMLLSLYTVGARFRL